MQARCLLPLAVFLLFAPTPGRGSDTAPSPSPIGSTQVYPLETIDRRCLPLAHDGSDEPVQGVADCRVSESGPFASLNDQTYYYALYCLIPDYVTDGSVCGSGSFSATFHRARALAVFVRQGDLDTVRLLLLKAEPEFELFLYSKPEIVATDSGPLLVLPVRIDGTGAGNASEYFLRTPGGWVPVEGHGWVEDLVRKIPPGTYLAKGIWPDLAAMTAVAHLYREGDPNCCPSGGKADIRLTLRDNRLVLESVSFELSR